jgi:Fic family protein
MKRAAGSYVDTQIGSLKTQAFIPHPLPPEPPIEWAPRLSELRDEANQCLGRLDGVSRILPEKSIFLYQYVRKEAVLSSQIEGTQSSLKDLLLFELEEAPGAPMDDVREVSNYVAALDHGLERIRTGQLPISLRLLNEMHSILLRKGRGDAQTPGEFRRSQVYVGGGNPPVIQFVPPPPQEIIRCLDPFEKFLHGQPMSMPVLTKAALAHVQFETIHPYLDGNGRLGRLLITLLLCAEGALSDPLLYLSLYFKEHRANYYERLQLVRTEGDWEGWLEFFFAGVSATARSATEAAQRVMELFRRDRERIETLGRRAGSTLRVHQLFQERPVLSTPGTADKLKMGWPTVDKAMQELAKLGIVSEFTGKKRYRLYAYDAYLGILTEGTDPIRR